MPGKHKKDKMYYGMLIILAAIMVIPVLYMCCRSFLSDTSGRFSLTAYYKVFFGQPEYLMKFWTSIALSLAIALGHTVISCMAGTALAKYRFVGRRFWFVLFLLFMVLPIQVTLVPSYILLEKLQLLNSCWALVIPGLFAPFGVVWMTLSFQAFPREWLEAASLDGAGGLKGVFYIMAPAAKPSVVSLFVLTFIESWNMVEQPINFLNEPQQYPLSVFLASVEESSQSIQAVCGVLCLLPVTLLFFYYNEELMEGIGDIFWS